MKQLAWNYHRITAPRARKIAKAGEVVYVVPCKVSPANLWGITVQVSTEDADNWDVFINAYTYYNCNHEMGYYPAFYTEK